MNNRELFELADFWGLSANDIETKLKNLRKDAPLLSKLIDALDVCIHAIDKNGNTIFYSKGTEKLEGFTEKDILGISVSQIYKTDDKVQIDERNSIILRVLKTGVPAEHQQMTYFLDNGKRIDIITDVYPILFKGEVVAAIAIFQDITKAKLLSDKVLELQRSLYKKLKKGTGTEFSFDNIIGSSPNFLETIAIAKKVAKSLSPVLIQGETGTGKELFAQSIHNQSQVSEGPFVAVNCAAIPDTLMESALFGTSKGAFTGAIEKAGLFEEAQNGTLFLDEINSMSIHLQSKLLRALQTKTIMRVGSTHSIAVNARIISALNAEPREAIKNKQLRSDIYYRLSAVTLVIPPLRERTSCIQDLVDNFIAKTNRAMGRNIKGVSGDVLAVLKNHNWPGNVRELEHVIEHAMNLAENSDIDLELCHLPAYLAGKPGQAPSPDNSFNSVKDLKDTLLDYEAEIIAAKLEEYGGNISRTAQALSISRQHLQYRMKRLSIGN